MLAIRALRGIELQTPLLGQAAGGGYMFNHVRYRSNVCRENLLIRPPELSQTDADQLDILEQASFRRMQACGHRRHKAVLPCVQAAGPLLPIVVDPNCESAHHPLGRGHSRR